ncbi:OLC1v1028249C1 [Oldenlandia corymbosa var. corymbosa]|uniref:OLC1v1028249C1 n=1 Tax=Oldenlandia corymbosa var. corymbosa TaxID=529605 RepID=A0AAV1CB99_OLDCO|nr:OLC1v1028249C1 [Oldenlandia corymbosa var. corymbosa]
MKQAARTSVLSHTWYKLWKCFSGCLDFERKDTMQLMYDKPKTSAHETRKFHDWVRKVLDSHTGPTVERLRIVFDMGRGYSKPISNWIAFAIRKNVRIFELDLTKVEGCRSGSRVNVCEFPSDLLLDENRSLPFPIFGRLTSLCLRSISVSDSDIEFFLSKCLLLEELVVEDSSSLQNVRVSDDHQTHKLKHMEIGHCGKLDNIEVSSKSLQVFGFAGRDTTNICFGNVPDISSVSLKLYYNAELFVLQMHSQLNLSRIQKLQLYLKGIDWNKSMKFPESFPEFSNLEQLELIFSVTRHGNLLCLSSILCASPRLQKLRLKYVKGVVMEAGGEGWIGDKKWEERTKSHTHKCLKVIEFIGWVGWKEDVQLVKYLIKSAVSLDKIEFDVRIPRSNNSNSWSREIFRDGSQHAFHSAIPRILEPALNGKVRRTTVRDTTRLCVILGDKTYLLRLSFREALNNEMSDQNSLAVFTFSLTLTFAFGVSNGIDPAKACIIDIRKFSSGNHSDCVGGNWDGFLSSNCCGNSFKGYLYGLAERTNKTGKVFLNSTEQNGCLSSMKNNEEDVFNCGIQRLTNGFGGCSDYSSTDVVDKLGNKFNSLKEGCKMLGSDGDSNQYCNQCLKSWEENLPSTTKTGTDSRNIEKPDYCSFAVLISVMSERSHEDQWFQAIYSCLGDKSLTDQASYVDSGQENHGEKKKKLYTDMGIVAASAAVLLIIVMAGLLIRKRMNKSSSSVLKVSSNFLFKEPSSVNISIKEVYAATNHLSESNLIGQGIAGKVYKGTLSNGQHIAAKHIINDGQMDTFVREVKSLAHITHPNLVSLIGHCDGDDECFLVYELCQNGNLSQWLYGKEKNLSWIQRLKIAIDCARGLSFLHTYPEGRIVHRDIKPTNILITANFQGKLSDFGLSKVMNMGQSFVSSEVRGTFGYVDPEYQQNRHVNSSGDVYSFGIVLLQLLSGQKVLNIDSNRPVLLNKLAKKLIRGGNMVEFADPKLNGDYSYEAFELVCNLALSCTGLKQQRPPMPRVVAKLEEALDISTRFDSFLPVSYS